MEREWTKALCGGDSAALASLNAAMKRIDLCCLIASPIMIGLVMQHAGGPPMVAATLVLLVWNLASLLPEVLLLRYAQRCSPALTADKAVATGAASTSSDIDNPTAASSRQGGNGGGMWRHLLRPLQLQAHAWALYAQQPAAAAALALALLYLTIMSWGTLMTAYLKTLGLPESELALYRG